MKFTPSIWYHRHDARLAAPYTMLSLWFGQYKNDLTGRLFGFDVRVGFYELRVNLWVLLETPDAA